MVIEVDAGELRDVVIISSSIKIEDVTAKSARGRSSLVLMNVGDTGELTVGLSWQADAEGLIPDSIMIESIGDEGDQIEVVEADGSRHDGVGVIPFFKDTLLADTYWFNEIKSALAERGLGEEASAARTAPEPEAVKPAAAPDAVSHEEGTPKPAASIEEAYEAAQPAPTPTQRESLQAIHDAVQENLNTFLDAIPSTGDRPLHEHMERVVIEPTYDSDVAFVGRKLLECQFSGIHPFVLSIFQTQAGNMVIVESYDQRVEVLRVPKEAVCSKVAAMGLSGADAKSVCRAFSGHKVVEID